MKIGDLVLYYSSIKHSPDGPDDVGLILGYVDVFEEDDDCSWKAIKEVKSDE